MYKIFSMCGLELNYTSRSYDMACRVAHFVRELGLDVGVVDTMTGRFVSEVSEPHDIKDLGAAEIAKRIL